MNDQSESSRYVVRERSVSRCDVVDQKTGRVVDAATGPLAYDVAAEMCNQLNADRWGGAR